MSLFGRNSKVKILSVDSIIISVQNLTMFSKTALTFVGGPVVGGWGGTNTIKIKPNSKIMSKIYDIIS